MLSFSTLTHSWKTWHRRFGHIDYSRLQALHEKDLVTSLTIDPKSIKLDCTPCIEAKQAHTDAIRKLTHIDLWGKYSVQLIEGNQY